MVEYARSQIIEDQTLVHKIWRGHNREWIFETDDEKYAYLRFLNKELVEDAGELHALCLMSNHTHEIYFVKKLTFFTVFLRRHHSLFGIFYNRKHDRSGAVSESRPKTEPIQNDLHEMVAVFYIHANPVRAGIFKSIDELKEYPWSTHLLYGYGIYKEWMGKVRLPQWYIDLGKNPEERQKEYMHLFRLYLDEPEIEITRNVLI